MDPAKDAYAAAGSLPASGHPWPKVGDEIVCRVEKIGTLRNVVVAP